MSERPFFSHPLIRSELLEKRAYQESIAKECLRANTLVCLPTGLGKSVIAAFVAAERLLKYPNKKVVVLAPTRPLVLQHFNFFKKVLKVEAEGFAAVTGQIPPEKRVSLWSKKIVFSTPQVFMNDLIAGRVDAGSVSLIVFDEAHRAVGEYAYTFIADRYSEEKDSLILGLTASPGTNLEEIRRICKNLWIKRVEARSPSSPDVKPYVKGVKVEWIKVPLPSIFYEIGDRLKAFVKEGVKRASSAGLLPPNPAIKVKDVLKAIEKARAQGGADTRVKEAVVSLYGLIHGLKALELLETQELSSLNQYMEGLFKRAERKGTASLRAFLEHPKVKEAAGLLKRAMESNVEHPKVDKLVKTVERELEGGARRIMVFTNYRSTASKLVKALNERLPGTVSAVRLVGQFKKDGDTGLTQREQVAILDDFKGGKHNVLVATQIGEEGLDIVECDEVIFYDSVPSAIRYIQRRGRTGRKTPGKVIVLMASGTKDEGYYWIAKRREKSMGEALAKLSRRLGGDSGQAKMDDFFKSLKEEKGGVKVLVDAREANSKVVSELSRLGAAIELRALPCGDFVVSDRIAVERKASEDFCSSIIDGRLFEQAKRLRESYERPVILVEGDPLFTVRNLRPEAVAGAVSSLLTDFGLSLISTRDPRETALLIYSLARREQIIERREPKVRSEKKPLSLSDLQEYIVSGLPGVNTVIAKRLLERFKSVEKVFTASERELKEVEGIGEKTSRRIREVLTATYSPGRSV